MALRKHMTLRDGCIALSLVLGGTRVTDSESMPPVPTMNTQTDPRLEERLATALEEYACNPKLGIRKVPIQDFSM
jgi:hypothetical protein